MKRLTTFVVSAWLALMLVLPISSFAQPGTATDTIDLSAPAAPGEFLIKFKPGTPNKDRHAVVQAHGGHVFDRIAGLDVEAAQFPALTGNAHPHAAEALVTALQHNPNVEYVEPNYIYTATYTPNDPRLSLQYAWRNIQAYSSWNITRGSSSRVIAIVDSGIQRNHPDLDAKIIGGYDWVQKDTSPDDVDGHGTHVAGTAAAETNNTTGVAGTCPNCRLMPVRVLGDNGTGTVANVANGIIFAADNGAKVINLSIEGSGSSTLQMAVDYAWNQGAFLACAAGNDGTSSTTSAFPGAYANCFAVASTDNADTRASTSNYGTWVEAAAPGVSIYSTVLGSTYGYDSGTSMATPHVAGLAGLLSSQGLTNTQIKQRMCNTADKISGTGTLWTCGRINALRAVMVGQRTSLNSFNFANYYLRHRDYLGQLTTISTDVDKQDATFRVVQGLADPSAISFESINFPGYFLRHQNFQLKLQPYANDDLFRKDATFRVRPGLASSTRSSFESVNFPGYYLRHKDFKLYLAQGTDDLFKKDATFEVVAPWWR